MLNIVTSGLWLIIGTMMTRDQWSVSWSVSSLVTSGHPCHTCSRIVTICCLRLSEIQMKQCVRWWRVVESWAGIMFSNQPLWWVHNELVLLPPSALHTQHSSVSIAKTKKYSPICSFYRKIFDVCFSCFRIRGIWVSRGVCGKCSLPESHPRISLSSSVECEAVFHWNSYREIIPNQTGSEIV